MHPQAQAAYRQAPRRLASLNDSASQQTQQIQGARLAGAAAAAAGGAAFISEEYLSYLVGGPCNRFALALKSSLENEIDWACARLGAATLHAPESWSLKTHAPFLVEAVLGVLERSRKEAAHARGGGRLRQALLAGTGRAGVVERARRRAELLATALFNMAQVGDNAAAMAQDLRVTIECTQWLRAAAGDAGLASVQAELLDVLDVLVPLAPEPAFDGAPVRAWPAFGARAAGLDALALVESCLWEQLVRVVCESAERKLVVGAVRVLVQSVSCHPQLARDILALPAPPWSRAGGCVGALLSARAAELLLAPDAEIVGACLELLLNAVRLEAMAQALDEELDAFARRASANGGAAGVKRRRRPDPPSGADSGAQTPSFLGPVRPASAAPAAGSEPTMLPDGLAAHVALVLQQWASAVSPPQPAASQPLDSPADALARPGAPDRSRAAPAPANRPPTEPELREACTWVLLNYELAPQQSHAQPPCVAVADIFSRYIVAKHAQTVPRIGRALSLSEIVRVIAAVFPKATLQQLGAKATATNSTDSLVALYLRPKTQASTPIPALHVDAAAQPPAAAPNSCLWLGCGAAFASEGEALAHIATHIGGADACRWRTCNRIPASQELGPRERERWIARHVLAHGPFFKDAAVEPEPEKRAEAAPLDLFALAKSIREEKSRILLDVSPLFANGYVPPDHHAHEVVLRLVMQGIGLIDQLQTWADRREGLRGLQDKARVWRNADEVLERLVFVAAQPLPTTHFAMRLLSVLRSTD
ncbi:hypothetical protein H4218_003145 [Coemansia sp. IMI 209128]|nr:hypothetical protein H4218_003145 [Coemansia sp. IMI 209128]